MLPKAPAIEPWTPNLLLQAMRQQWALDKASHAAGIAAASAAAVSSDRDGSSSEPNIPNEICAAFAPPRLRVPVLSLPEPPFLHDGQGSSRLHR